MKALVIGGTGPSGPHTVNGFLERGYEVTILHGGQHEVDFTQPVEHIHADPHFEETLAPALEGRSFDVVLATYGRMRIIANLLRGKTGRFIGVGGASVYAHREDRRWGPLGPPSLIPEDAPRCDDPSGPKFNYLMWVSEETVLRAHREGHYNATYFRYPLLYGPRSPANPEWSIVRRILDGRRRLIIPANGMLKRRGFARNAAHALLLAVDKPGESGGRIYNLRDELQYSQRQYVDFITRHLGHDCEIVEVPPVLAARVYKGAASSPLDWTRIEYDIGRIRTELGYHDLTPTAQALAESVDWLVSNPPEHGGEIERQLSDPFAYAAEDSMLKAYKTGYDAANAVQFPEVPLGHMYRHPKMAGEAWAPPSMP